jgi:uncharacterized protein HemX
VSDLMNVVKENVGWVSAVASIAAALIAAASWVVTLQVRVDRLDQESTVLTKTIVNTPAASSGQICNDLVKQIVSARLDVEGVDRQKVTTLEELAVRAGCIIPTR